MRPEAPALELPSPSQAPAAPSIPPLFEVPTGDEPRCCPECQATIACYTYCKTQWCAADAAGETHPSRVRPLEDNVLLYLKPRPERMQGSSIVLPVNRQGKSNGVREAIVLASGPGWRLRGGRGPLVPTEVTPGECVVVDERAGQDWSLDVAKPRTNPRGCSWESFPVPTALERPGGEYRMVRADEILIVLEGQRPEDEALELDYGALGRR